MPSNDLVITSLESALDSAQRISIQGWPATGGRCWIVDIVTADCEGHGNNRLLANAVRQALQDLVLPDNVSDRGN